MVEDMDRACSGKHLGDKITCNNLNNLNNLSVLSITCNNIQLLELWGTWSRRAITDDSGYTELNRTSTGSGYTELNRISTEVRTVSEKGFDVPSKNNHCYKFIEIGLLNCFWSVESLKYKRISEKVLSKRNIKVVLRHNTFKHFMYFNYKQIAILKDKYLLMHSFLLKEIY